MGLILPGIVASGPAGGRVDVTVPAFDPDQVFEDVLFVANGVPAVGDDCLVIFDDSDERGQWALVP